MSGRPSMRRRAVWCCLKFGLLPSRLYERERHYGCSYWAHLLLNARYGWRWLRGRETADDIAFELETNW